VELKAKVSELNKIKKEL
jgi:DNA repair exonuclease SbcCD ATPase subunit